MSKRRIRLMFDHPTPTCDDVVVDIHLPLPDPIEDDAEAIAERVRPACPICKQPAHAVRRLELQRYRR